MNSLLVGKHDSSSYFEMLFNPSDPEIYIVFLSFCAEWLYNSFESLLLVGVNLLILLFLFRRRHHRIKRFRLVGPWLVTLVTFRFKDSHVPK